MLPLKATVLDDDRFRLLAIPFGGPIPHPAFPRGVDLDGETFTERTDIKAGWLSERIVDWHHGQDPQAGRTAVGKAINPEMDEDGWWVDVWVKHGERRMDLIRRIGDAIAGKGQVFGSSEPMAGFVAKEPWQGGGKAANVAGLAPNHPLRQGLAREIKLWAYERQTLSTSPQNTLSIIRPLKATLDDLASQGMSPTAAFWSDVEGAMRDLSADLRGSSADELTTKAGRVLHADNEAQLQAALTALEASMARAEDVLTP